MQENESQYFLKIQLFDWLHLRERGEAKEVGLSNLYNFKEWKR